MWSFGWHNASLHRLRHKVCFSQVYTGHRFEVAVPLLAEFCILLPQTSPAEAVQTALRIRKRVSGMSVSDASYHMQVTVSIGVDSFDGRQASSVDQLRRNANRALQEAKRRGKNQVWLFSGSEQGHEQGAEAAD